MSTNREESLETLIRELIEEAEVEFDGVLEPDTSLIESGLLDSLSLLSIAEWVDDELAGALDLKKTNLREEWDSMGAILDFVRERS